MILENNNNQDRPIEQVRSPRTPQPARQPTQYQDLLAGEIAQKDLILETIETALANPRNELKFEIIGNPTTEQKFIITRNISELAVLNRVKISFVYKTPPPVRIGQDNLILNFNELSNARANETENFYQQYTRSLLFNPVNLLVETDDEDSPSDLSPLDLTPTNITPI